MNFFWKHTSVCVFHYNIQRIFIHESLLIADDVKMAKTTQHLHLKTNIHPHAVLIQLE